jgi:hypothetical protein
MKKIILLIVLTFIASCSSEQWYAMGRHGGCYDLAEFSTTAPLISGSKTPSDIASKLKKAGIKYTLTKRPTGVINLDVPSKEWGLILVQKKLCHEFANIH